MTNDNFNLHEEIYSIFGIKPPQTYVLKRKADGWYVSPGSNHSSNPERAITLNQEELKEWIEYYGNDYEAVLKSNAKEIL